MGKSNVVIRQWLSNKERFASFVNGALFQGMQIFHADKLRQDDGQQGVVLKNAEGKSIAVERYRDITMTAQDETKIIILACENQEEIHYAMPVRNMLYDALSYMDQIREIRQQRKSEKQLQGNAEFLSGLKKADMLYPVITIVFYYGEESWDGQKDLHGLLGIEREEYKMLRKFIPNYGINLIDPKEMEDLKCFRKDLQMVFGMLQYRKDKTDLINYVKSNEDFFANVDIETGNAVKVLLGSEKPGSQTSECGAYLADDVLGNPCSARQLTNQIDASKGYHQYHQCQRRYSKVRRYRLRLNIFFIIIQKKNMNQVDAKGARAPCIYRFFCSFF